MSKTGTAMIKAADEIIEMTADLVEPADMDAVKAFAAKLCGLEGQDVHALIERFRDLPLPGDFRHFRLTNLVTGEFGGSQVTTDLSPLEMRDLIWMITYAAKLDSATGHGPGVWTETVALPIKDEGTLELGIRYRPLS